MPTSITDEPTWLAKRRAAGVDLFKSLAMPTARDEDWRFASVGKLSIDDFAPVEAPANATLDALTERSNLVSTRAGRSVYVDDAPANFEGVSQELAEQGVIYLPLAEAIAQHPELLEKYFLQESTELGSQKFFGLHAATVKAGSVLYVPKGVEIAEPFVNYYWTSGARAAVFPHTLIIAEDNSKASVVDIFFSETTENEALNISVSNIHAGANAHVFRKIVQDWNEKTVSFQLDTTVAERDAQVQNVAVNIGAERARFESQTRIEGPGADVKMYSLTVAEESQEFDQRTFQTHNAPNAVSDLLYKNALLDNSRTIFSGLIKVAEGAQQTDAYQTNRNLLLDPTADANSLPGLEILANDVRCSHGATTGNVDEAELFYMMQRGISRRVAMQLMVFGFFEEVIEKIDSDELAENLRQLIHNKFESKIK
ncbi:Fe-S cluster assembly protein SufD [Coraliomargarita sp. SDUM461003]|uniref:Fe-S cluster assembly protein SufD n=1 Tax=Thalassobacterium maritimum TaxID=3041265 RepID=A0ABU1AQU9_9BACT|nr:Fe-S cluster assembly protein SufD [Coraliomargarita sp. SDUM461003]MDQ8206532.1 Fe-S cluster assembly protein SufD [Coraliomargarita sp. SDUM461003]